MWRQSSQSTKSSVPSRVSRSSGASKLPVSRLSSLDRQSSGKSSRFSVLDGMPFSRFSICGKRVSSGVDRGRLDVKDSRPLNSRAYQQQCVKTILEFLETYHFPLPITAKTLMSPKTKDFLNIFEFVVKHFDPKYKLADKYDEDIPRFFRAHGYPFLITKSSMVTIGSPHSWPALLAALVWLTEIVKASLIIEEETDNIIFQQEDFDNTSDSQMILKYYEESYRMYMEGEDIDSVDHMLQDAFQKKYSFSETRLNKLQQENNMLDEQLQECECVEDNLEDLRENKMQHEKDLIVMKNYSLELQDFTEKLNKGIDDMTRELELQASETRHLSEQLESLQSVIAQQEYSPADVERMKMEEEQLRGQLEAHQATEADIDQQIWNVEVDIVKTHEKSTENTKHYNRLAQKLLLLPESAPNAGGLNFEMRPNIAEDQLQCLKTQLMVVKEKITDALHSAKSEQRHYLNLKEQAIEQCNEKESQLVNLKTELCRLEENYKHDKKFREQYVESRQNLYDKDYAEMNEDKKNCEVCRLEIGLLQVEVTNMRELFDRRMAACQKKEKDSLQFLRKVADRVKDHKSAVKAYLDSTHSKISAHKAKSQQSLYVAKYA
ncbi:kinetochore protein NDC80 homolog [Argonauta hians]